MPPRKKSSKPKKAAGRKPAKKAVKKRAVVKKPAKKKAAKKKAVSKKASAPKAKKAPKPGGNFGLTGAEPATGNLCRCIQRGNRWFCMRPDGSGHLIKVDGPFASKEECEENALCE